MCTHALRSKRDIRIIILLEIPQEEPEVLNSSRVGWGVGTGVGWGVGTEVCWSEGSGIHWSATYTFKYMYNWFALNGVCYTITQHPHAWIYIFNTCTTQYTCTSGVL